MIINTDKLREFERSEIAREDISYKDALAIFEGLRKEAVSLGAFSCENILEGLEVDIRIARAVNGLR
ncbi:MAG: hypothetical protein MUP16_09690 [Sedimentisphaerales bacterium]|jgi:hypothetical protein|nr:hypothetical protein [Sedimentisphaerales bacterium]